MDRRKALFGIVLMPFVRIKAQQMPSPHELTFKEYSRKYIKPWANRCIVEFGEKHFIKTEYIQGAGIVWYFTTPM